MAGEKQSTKTIAVNRQARHEYFVIEALETGIELRGTEVKSLRAGGVNLKDSWVDVDGGELVVKGMHITPYDHGNIFNADPTRERRLLAHKSEIRRLGMKAGLAFNPGTDIASLRWLAPDLDMVLVMSVNPGFSGQKFIPQSFDKIRATRAMLNAAGAGDVLIQVDGGACPENTAQLVAAGADVLVSGSAFFGHPPYDQCHQKFQAAAQAAADNAHNARCAAAALWQPGRALKK